MNTHMYTRTRAFFWMYKYPSNETILPKKLQPEFIGYTVAEDHTKLHHGDAFSIIHTMEKSTGQSIQFFQQVSCKEKKEGMDRKSTA